MTDNDFRKAIDVQIIRWRFDQMIERASEQTGPPPGAGTEPGEVPTRLASSPGLLAPRDTAPTLHGRGGSGIGDL